MNNEENEQPLLIPETPVTPSFDTEELDRDIAWLRGIVFWVVAGLLLLTLAVNLFLWRQVQGVRAEIVAQRKYIDEYSKADPAVRDLMRRLQAFALTHPDFQQVMAKYGATSTNAAPPTK
jgi:hypothetical protein